MSLVKPLADRLSQVSTFKNIAKIKDCLRLDGQNSCEARE
jgi:hypothetical protein